MKDFQEFCNSLDQEFINDILSDTTYTLNQKAPLANTLITGSFAITMRVLERYHEWLNSDK